MTPLFMIPVAVLPSSMVTFRFVSSTDQEETGMESLDVEESMVMLPVPSASNVRTD